MGEPVPAPYDIVPIPRFPYVPSLEVWGMAIGCFIVLLAIFVALRRLSRTRRRSDDAVVSAQRDLTSLLQAQNLEPKLLAERGSAILRRLLSLTHDRSFVSLSKSELEALKSSPRYESAKSIIEKIAALETVKFAPETSVKREHVCALIGECAALTAHHRTEQRG